MQLAVVSLEDLATALKKAQGGDKQGLTGGLFSTKRRLGSPAPPADR